MFKKLVRLIARGYGIAITLLLLALSQNLFAQCALTITPANPVPNNRNVNVSVAMNCGGIEIKNSDPYFLLFPPALPFGAANGVQTIPTSFQLGTNIATGNYTIQAYQCVTNGGTPKPVGQSFCAEPNSILVATQTLLVVMAAGVGVNAAPTVALTAPANNATFTAPATINITANAADSDGTIQRVEFFNGAALLGTDTTAPYTFSWPNVAAGTYAITARATDNLNAQTTTAPISITVNAAGNILPTAAVTAPANNATFSAPATINITANASDSDGTIQSVEFFNGTTSLGTDTTAPYAVPWPNVAAGTYSITAVATDNLGAQTTSAPISITVNAAANVPPTVVISGPPPGPNFIAPAAIQLQAIASDNDGTVARVEFFNGATSVGVGVQQSEGSTLWGFSWTNVAAGTYSITVRATDNAGATTTTSPYPIIVDGQAPTVAITAPANNATFIAPAAITISANASDADGAIARVEFFNGTALLGTVTTAPYTFTWPNVAAGTYTITARATDNSNTSTISAAVAVIVNPPANVPPTISITAPANGANSFTAPATIAIQVRAADSDGTVARVEFFNGTTPLGTVTAAPFTYSWLNVAAGTYAITARATDNGNATTTSAAVQVTIQPPIVPVAPTIACAVQVQPTSISPRDAVTLRALCTRNNVPLTIGSGEQIEYLWTAGAQSPPIPGGAQRQDVLTLPAGTFKTAGRYEYRVVATLTSQQFNGAAASPASAGVVSVTRQVGKIELITPPGGLRINPGVEASFTVRAGDDAGGIQGVVVTWRIDNGNTKSAVAKASMRKDLKCPDADSPSSGPLAATGPSGETTLKFTPSCASGGRNIMLSADGFSQMFALAGPNQSATTLTLQNKGAVVVEPNKLAQIPVIVQDANGVKVASASTVWQLIPGDAGTVTSPAVSNENGEARSIIVLKESAAAAIARVCIDGRADACVDIQIRNTKLAIQAPAESVLQPMVRQSIDAPRVQLNNVRNRLQQLRVEENNTEGASSKSGTGAQAKLSGLGLFVLGDVEVAKRDPANGDKGYKLRSKGVTVGADYRPTGSVVVGAAVGLLKGDTKAGDNGEQKSKGYSGTVFGQWLPAKNWYSNMIINVGKNTYDSSRTSIGGDVLKGRGISTQQGFQVEGGYSLAKDATRLTPFVRYELIRAKLKPFEESGGTDAVAIGGQKVRADTFGAGAVAEHAFSTTSGVWVPSARVEFLRESQSQDDVYARLVNGTPVLVPLNPELIDKNYGTWGLNLQWLAGPGGNLISSFIGYEQTFGKTGFKSDRFTAGVKIPF
jgi:Autotransporter beta-domain/Bacterial Ig domain